MHVVDFHGLCVHGRRGGGGGCWAPSKLHAGAHTSQTFSIMRCDNDIAANVMWVGVISLGGAGFLCWCWCSWGVDALCCRLRGPGSNADVPVHDAVRA